MRFRICTALVFVIAALGMTTQAQAYRGWASWYGPGLYGNRMACGGTLTSSTWGVAHKYYRCGTVLTICYRRCVRARVVDRGPYVSGRVLDLTYPVKRAIGMSGVALVRYYH